MESHSSRRVFSLFSAVVCVSAALTGFLLPQPNPISDSSQFDVGNERCWLAKCRRSVIPSDTGGYQAPLESDLLVESIAYSVDKTRIAAIISDGTIRQWDAESGAPIGARLSSYPVLVEAGEPALMRAPPPLARVAYSPDMTQILGTSIFGTLERWDADSGAVVSVLLGSSVPGDIDSELIPFSGESLSEVMSVAYSPDGTRVATVIDNGSVWQWDVETGTHIGEPLVYNSPIEGGLFPVGFLSELMSVAYSPDGQRILASVMPNEIWQWDAESRQIVGPLLETPTGTFEVTSLAYSPDGTSIAAGSGDGRILVWDVGTGALIEAPQIDFFGAVTSVAYSPDGTRIVATSQEGDVWQSSYGLTFANGTLLGPLNSAISATYSPDGTHILVVEYNGALQTWRVSSVTLPLLVWVLLIAAVINVVVFLALRRSSDQERDKSAPALKSDQPIDTLTNAPDALKDIVKRITAFVRNPNASAPLIIAVTGKWGTGKSSLMRLIEEDLRKDYAPCVWFNAWHHQNETHLFASLMESIRRDAVITNPRSFRQFASNLDFRLNLVRERLCDRPLAVFGTALLLTAILIVLVWSLVWSFVGVWQQAPDISDISDIVSALQMELEGLVIFLVSSASFAGLLFSRINPLKGFGITPASLLESSRKWFHLPRFRDRLSFRDHFGRAFREVCSAIGPRRLVIIIDDLDRCRPDQVVEILEAVNFLTSNGKCFVFLGIDEHQVNHAVGLHYADIAEQMRIHKKAGQVNGRKHGRKPEVSGVMSDAERMAARQSYAKHYLQKLINIRIPVPVADEKALRELAGEVP